MSAITQYTHYNDFLFNLVEAAHDYVDAFGKSLRAAIWAANRAEQGLAVSAQALLAAQK